MLTILARPEEFLDTAVTVSQIVTPWLPLAGVIAGGILLGAFNSHNRRKGNEENRAPDVNEAWEEARTVSHELDIERKLRRRLQTWAWDARVLYRSYVDRVQAGGSTDLTVREKHLYNSEPPTDEVNLPNP